jgi:hypothetical protein
MASTVAAIIHGYVHYNQEALDARNRREEETSHGIIRRLLLLPTQHEFT